MMYLGNIAEDATIRFLWSTNDGDGASITRTTDGTVSVYKDGGTTQSVAGVTDTEDFDSLTGIHLCIIDTSADAFYATGSDFVVVLSGSTIDGQSVNAVLAQFSIENRFVEVDVTKIGGDAQSATDLKDFVDAGYDPATNKVQGVVTVDTTTANTDMVGTNGANTTVPDAAGTAAALHVTTDAKIDVTDGLVGGLNNISTAQVNTEVDTALSDIKLDHLVAVADADDAVDNSIVAKLAASDGDWSGYDNSAASLEALRARGDAAWVTGGGGGISDILNVTMLVPMDIDLAGTATYRLGMMLTNAVDDLPATAEITPGTIDIHRKAIGGTSWSVVVSGAACSEAAGMIYYDEVFDSGTGYVEGDSIRVTFKGQKITVAANDYEISDATGRMFYTNVRQTMRGTDGANTTVPNTTIPDAAGIAATLHVTTDAKIDTTDGLIGGLNNISTAQVNTECDSAIADAEPIDANVTQLGGVTQSLTDLKDFADDGYDPSTHKVNGVKLVDASTDMRGTDSANTTVPDAAGIAATLHVTTDAKIDVTDGLVTTVDGVVDTIQTTTDKLDDTVEDESGGLYRFTENALEQAPSGTGGDATAANQTLILEDLADIEGTGFVKDTNSLTNVSGGTIVNWTIEATVS